MEPFNFTKNKKRIEETVNKHIALAGLNDPDGFTLLEGFIAPTINQTISDNMTTFGRNFPTVAVIGNSTGLVYYFYLDKLFPGEGLE